MQAQFDQDAENDDTFGMVAAAGDFNGDRYMDLAIGVPHEHITNGRFVIPGAGAIEVI